MRPKSLYTSSQAAATAPNTVALRTTSSEFMCGRAERSLNIPPNLKRFFVAHGRHLGRVGQGSCGPDQDVRCLEALRLCNLRFLGYYECLLMHD